MQRNMKTELEKRQAVREKDFVGFETKLKVNIFFVNDIFLFGCFELFCI